ncbi:unnamed protein product [Ilex paraguariensis]|uniref:F-box protein At3g26010-like beta-propeller domain-containing protein n=1 Tax=Ilex paraguariensis TaxID=185542 RepID=A0ABC8TZE2_9AQUA
MAGKDRAVTELDAGIHTESRRVAAVSFSEQEIFVIIWMAMVAAVPWIYRFRHPGSHSFPLVINKEEQYSATLSSKRLVFHLPVLPKVSSFVAVTIRLISSAIPLKTSGYHYLNRACDVKALAVGFSCSEDDMMSFKVIRASIRLPQIEDNKLQIETFSSQTGKWKTSQLSFPSKFSLIPYEKCDVMGGIFYWRAKGDAVAAYDPGMGKNHVWLMRFPTTGLNGMVRAMRG